MFLVPTLFICLTDTRPVELTAHLDPDLETPKEMDTHQSQDQQDPD